MCLKLKVPSPASRPPSGWISCLCDEPAQVQVELGAGRAAREFEDRSAGERAPDDGARLHDRALARVEPVEARRQQRVDRRRHGEGRGSRRTAEMPDSSRSHVALVDEHPHELLDEQRVALGAGEDAVGEVGRDARVADEVLDEQCGSRRR